MSRQNPSTGRRHWGSVPAHLRSFSHQYLGRYRVLVLVLALVWGVGDAVSTLFATYVTAGAAMEANPLVRPVLSLEPLLFPVVKLAVIGVVSVALLHAQRLVERVPAYRGWFVSWTGVGLLVTCNNLVVGLAALA